MVANKSGVKDFLRKLLPMLNMLGPVIAFFFLCCYEGLLAYGTPFEVGTTLEAAGAGGSTVGGAGAEGVELVTGIADGSGFEDWTAR
jgi:hypothetical protein